MFKIISAKLAAREIVKNQISDEVSKINKEIEKAIKENRKEILYKEDISKATVQLLKKAGYKVINWEFWDIPTTISWMHIYYQISEDKFSVSEIAQSMKKVLINYINDDIILNVGQKSNVNAVIR